MAPQTLPVCFHESSMLRAQMQSRLLSDCQKVLQSENIQTEISNGHALEKVE